MKIHRAGTFRQFFPAAALLPLLCAALVLGTLVPAGGTPAPPQPKADAPALSEDGWALFQRVFSLVLRDYVDPKTSEQVIRGALQGAASAAGPESAYIPPERVKAYRDALRATHTLPIYITKGDDFARVLSAFPDLEKGPEPGDFLKSVGGTSTYDLTYAEVQILLAGKEGTTASCVFLKRDAFETYRLTLPFLPPPPPRWWVRPKGDVLVLTALPTALPPAIEASIKASKTGTVLVDLKSCAEGDSQAALVTAGLLIGKSPGPTSKGQKGEIRHALAGPGLLAGRRIKVLVGPNTARGGEVLARALESGGALLVGETTTGWAPQAEIVPLENGGLLRMNTAFFLDREGKPVKEKGLEPLGKLPPVKDETREAYYDRALAAEAPEPSPSPREKGAEKASKSGAGGHGA
jgi:carboxyl-terminal processing protease